MENTEDKRKYPRSLCYLKVIEEDTGEYLGHLDDIHHEGLSLISDNVIPLHEDMSVCIETMNDNIRIPLVVKGVWNRLDEGSSHYVTGCRIVNPSSEAIDAIPRGNTEIVDYAMILLKALQEYGKHKPGCSYEETACDCGLEKLIYSYNHKLPKLRDK